MNTLTNLKLFDKKIIFITERIFKILFLIYAAVSYCSVTYGHPIISIFMWATILVGAIVLLQRLVLFKEYKSMPILLPCIAFTVCLCISLVANIAYDLKLNIILLGYFVFYFFILFTHNENTTLDNIKKEMNFFSVLFIIYTTIAIIAGFVIMFTGFSSLRLVNADNFEIIVGFKFGRLWGIFLGPNGGAVFTLVSIIMLIRYLFKSKKLIFKVLLAFNIIIHMLYITFSDSRTALVSFLVIPICSALLYTITSGSKKRLRFVKAVLSSVLVTVLCFGFVHVAKASYNGIIKSIQESNSQSSDSDSDNDDENNLELIDRNYDLQNDYSNRRFDLWKSGFEVFTDSTKNILVGTSYYGMRLYSYDHLPDTYLVNNTQTDFANFHNEFINIMVAQGLLGLAAVIWMILSVIIYAVKKLKHFDASNALDFTTAAAIILVLALSSMFIPGIFYLFAPSSIIFWMFLGYAIMILKKGCAQEA